MVLPMTSIHWTCSCCGKRFDDLPLFRGTGGFVAARLDVLLAEALTPNNARGLEASE